MIMLMEMRDQEGRVVHQEVGRRHGQKHACHAADDEGHDEAHVHSIDGWKVMRPRYIVSSQLNTFTPVGTAMIMVVTPKKG